MKTLRLGLVLAASVLLSADVFGQIAVVRNSVGRLPTPEFRITKVEVNADVKEQVATVQIAQTFQNVSNRTLETQFLFPLPDGAAINGLTLIVDGKELTGELKRKEEARKVYEEIVRRQRDPALLEYMGCGLFKTSVFPIPAGQNRRVEIRYTQLLKSDTGLVDFSLPLGTTKHAQHAIENMTVTVRITSKGELRNIYSPTHDFKIDQPSDNRATCRLQLHNVGQPNDVRLLYGTRGNDIGMNLVSYQPDGDEQGYFLLLATPKVKVKKGEIISKTVLFVVDRSGSMSGEKIAQAKASLSYMINSLGPKDTFNIVSYSSEVDLFRPELELVSDETRKQALAYVEDIYSGGGTNINEALTVALDQLKDRKRPGYVMFLTDGLPTIGVTGETDIAANVRKANHAHARIFSFGVGYDVNSRLLDRLSRDQRGTSVYVKPEEDIEVAATNLFQKVSSPAMTGLKVRFVAESSNHSGKLVTRVYPQQLPDLFRGEQLVAAGRYKTDTPVTVELTGNVAGKMRTMTLETEFGDAASTRRNGFVEILWATRRIGEIISDLDLNGQNQELIDELVSLSLKHGIMTPYTSFLAEEEVSLGDRRRLMTEAATRANEGLSITSGFDAFHQRDFKQSLQNAQRADQAGAAQPSFSIRLGSRRQAENAPAPPDAGGKYPSLSRAAAPKDSSSAGGAARGLGGGGFGNAGNQPASASGRSFGVAAKNPQENKKSADYDTPGTPVQRIKRIGIKTFYWKNSEWQDSELSSLKKKLEEKDIIRVVQFSDEYFALTKIDKGRWSQFLTLTRTVLIRIKDKTYRIVPPPTEEVPSGDGAEKK